MDKPFVICSIFFIVSFLNGCTSVKVKDINEYYQDKYSLNVNYSTNRLINDARKKVFKKYFKTQIKNRNKIIIIENHRFPNGNFDSLWSYFYFHSDSTIRAIYYRRSDENEIIQLNIDDSHFDNSIDTIIKLYKNKQCKKLQDLHKEYPVSDTGTFYISEINEEFKILNGIRFIEFMIDSDLLKKEMFNN